MEIEWFLICLRLTFLLLTYLCLRQIKIMEIDFEKSADGLVPAIVQDAETRKIFDARLYEPRISRPHANERKSNIFFTFAANAVDERRNERQFFERPRNFD